MIEDIQHIYVTIDKRGEFHFHDWNLYDLYICNLELDYFYIVFKTKISSNLFNNNKLLFKISYPQKLDNHGFVNCKDVIENLTGTYMYISSFMNKSNVFVISDGNLYLVAYKYDKLSLEGIPGDRVSSVYIDLYSKSRFYIPHKFIDQV